VKNLLSSQSKWKNIAGEMMLGDVGEIPGNPNEKVILFLDQEQLGHISNHISENVDIEMAFKIFIALKPLILRYQISINL